MTWLGCLSSPSRPTDADGGGAADAAVAGDGAVSPDAPVVDASVTDASVTDASVTDSALADAPPADGAAADAPVADASVTDASSADAPPPDAFTIDAIPPDAALPGTGMDFPPLAGGLNITGGWSGDLNGDGAEDVVLLNDAGDSATAGLYVLFGKPGAFLGSYQQFMNTGEKDPVSVVATQLDGTGPLDLVAYTVDYNDPGDNFDNEFYLLAYEGVGAGFTDPPAVNWVSEGLNQGWHGPFEEGREVDMVVARIDPTKQPTIAVVHTRGALSLTLPSWSRTNFTNTSAQTLLTASSSGLRVVPSITHPTVDDLIVWTDDQKDLKWLRNDGTGNLTDNTVNAEPRGPVYAELYDMDGVPPLDVIGVVQTEIQTVPIDVDPKTTSAEYNGQSYITGVAYATDLLVFDSNGGGGPPEIVFSSTSCASVGDEPCLFMIRNAFVNGTSGNLESPSVTRQWQLPSGFVPRVMFRGDFDGDGSVEVVVFSADGSMACVRIDNELFSSCS